MKIGHCETGESDLTTAFRETEEESGFTKDDLKVYENCKEEMEYLVKNKPKTVIYWLAELINKSKDVQMSKEHQDFKWLPIDEACRYAAYTEMQSSLKNVDKYICENLVQLMNNTINVILLSMKNMQPLGF